ncbi:MAG: SagB/ThcOx family dehydrogenase, partial [Erysipelotrichaceae bacterium]|nr:SagB/ThcOx family dehydrogenase [Erysipelotrichaceae bacterium]
MDEKEIKRRYQEGRAFLKYGRHDEFSDFQSDQQLKKPQPPLVKAPMREEKIQLPMDFSELDLNMNLTDILVARKSNRVFTEDKMTITQLSYLLWATQGIKDIRGKSYATLRTVPSGGARHPFETYLMVQKVEGLEPGRYHYLPMGHALEYLGPCENMGQVITDSLVGQSWAAKSAVVFYWSFVPYRSEWRYGI